MEYPRVLLRRFSLALVSETSTQYGRTPRLAAILGLFLSIGEKSGLHSLSRFCFSLMGGKCYPCVRYNVLPMSQAAPWVRSEEIVLQNVPERFVKGESERSMSNNLQTTKERTTAW